jgi:hypothetical protein
MADTLFPACDECSGAIEELYLWTVCPEVWWKEGRETVWYSQHIDPLS